MAVGPEDGPLGPRVRPARVLHRPDVRGASGFRQRPGARPAEPSSPDPPPALCPLPSPHTLRALASGPRTLSSAWLLPEAPPGRRRASCLLPARLGLPSTSTDHLRVRPPPQHTACPGGGLPPSELFCEPGFQLDRLCRRKFLEPQGRFTVTGGLRALTPRCRGSPTPGLLRAPPPRSQRPQPRGAGAPGGVAGPARRKGRGVWGRQRPVGVCS